MASTIETGFQLLKARLEVTEDQRAAIVSHQGELEKVISKGFDTHGTILSGAYSRNTMIAVKKDTIIDVFLVLRASYGREYTPTELLYKLQDTLFKNGKEAHINTDGHGVAVPLSDYKFIITPCFHREGKGYVIPDYGNDDWIRTYPNLYSDQLKQADKWHEGNLLPIIKIIKCWNHVNNHIFDEYYLELLVYQILTDIPIASYTSAVRHIFRKARLEVVFTIDDPAGFDTQVQGLKDSEMLAEAMISFNNAYKKILKAKDHEHEGDLNKAYNEWESIFTGYFPTPLQMLIRELEDSGIEGVKALQIIRDRGL